MSCNFIFLCLGTVHASLYCRHKQCPGLFFAKIAKGTVILRTDVSPIQHSAIPRQVRNQRRKTLRHDLEKGMPNEIRARIASKDEIDATEIPSLSTIQKIRSEMRLKGRVSPEPIMDFLMRCDSLQPHYVHGVIVDSLQPVTIPCWFQSALEILRVLRNRKEGIRLGIDSTAAPLTPWKNGTGIYYYYAVVPHISPEVRYSQEFVTYQINRHFFA
jgi:hypothetical protein